MLGINFCEKCEVVRRLKAENEELRETAKRKDKRIVREVKKELREELTQQAKSPRE